MRSLFLLALVMMIVCCGKTRPCTSGTVLVSVELDGMTATADTLTVVVSINSVAGSAYDLAHRPGAARGAIEIDFPSGYLIGAHIDVEIQAKLSNVILGAASGSIQLAAGCGTLSLAVGTIGVGDDLGLDGGVLQQRPAQCDLDGDGYEREDSANGCPDSKDTHPGMVDCNDDDSGVFPGSTSLCGGTEAGNTATGRLVCSLRQDCRTVYETTGPVASGTPRVSAYGWLVGDMDCNGVAYQGCPPPTCDADGDGWPVNNGSCAAVDGQFDCDDTNPTIYPGAPASCGLGPAEDCASQRQPCTMDADGDGWNAGPDCNDDDPTVHPWAVELCDGKDNDCDGLIDEGNPDAVGKPLVADGAVTTCTDSNVGECAKLLGTCVCSAVVPTGATDPQNRTFCPTEQMVGAIKPPRCFGAGLTCSPSPAPS